jgi:uncharacterized membrane protein
MFVVGVIAPLLIVAAGIVAVIAIIPDLPDPVAVHWGWSGTPDGFGSPTVALLLIAVPVLGYSAFAFAVARYADDGVFTINQRFILVVAPFLSGVITVSLGGSLLIQRGLADAREAPSAFPVLGVGLVVGLALSVVGWVVLPRVTPAVPTTSELPMLDLADSARASWTQRIAPSRLVVGVLTAVGLIAIVGGGIVFWSAASALAGVILIGALIVLAVLVGGSLFWRVRIDSAGVDARSAIGFPRFTIPLGEIQSAAVITVKPAGDFGGWGIRWGGRGRLGIITRGGDALEVRRTNGRMLVVTVSDPVTGAALINTLRQRVE